MKTWEKIWDFLVITFATVLIAAGVFFFMIPSDVSIGSIAALAMVLTHYVPLSVATLTMIMNAVLLILGFIFIGKEFGVKTVYTAMLLPAVLGVFEFIFPENPALIDDKIINVICYCMIVGFGQAMLFGRNASSGGLDIVAKFMNKYLHMDLGKAVGIAGMAVALTAAFVFDAKAVALSVLGTYLNGILVDRFIFGNTLRKRVCILSKKNKEILDYILHELHVGATTYHAYGAFSETCQNEINTIVDKNEYLKLMTFIRKTDPDAFVTVYTVNDLVCKPRKS